MRRKSSRARAGRIGERVREFGKWAAPPGSLRRRALGPVHEGVRAVAGQRVGSRASISPIVLPTAARPRVSIVIPVRGHWELTAQCLRSIAADRAQTSYEVLVVDDASEDDTAERLGEIGGVQVLSLADNVGFLGAANAGFSASTAPLVVLLNNDTVVQAGWLDALVGTLDRWPRAGVVGAKLVYPDGTLQEAGGIVWHDASGCNVGRHQDAADAQFNFVRDVDYCSGACLLVRGELLEELGGLDPRYSPAYYEDTDLCFAARQRGYRVLYQPAAVVCHLEGGSHGTDTAQGVKRHQELNRSTFRAKWAGVLAGHPLPSPKVRASAWRPPGGRALVVDPTLAADAHGPRRERRLELLDVLGELGFGVTVTGSAGIHEAQRREMGSRGVEVLASQEELAAYLDEVGDELRFAVFADPAQTWPLFLDVRRRAPAAKLVYDAEEICYLAERRRTETEGTVEAAQSAELHRALELTFARLSDSTWVPSEPVRRSLLADEPALNVEVVPLLRPGDAVGRVLPLLEARSAISTNSSPASERGSLQLVLGEALAELGVLVAGRSPGSSSPPGHGAC